LPPGDAQAGGMRYKGVKGGCGVGVSMAAGGRIGGDLTIR